MKPAIILSVTAALIAAWAMPSRTEACSPITATCIFLPDETRIDAPTALSCLDLSIANPESCAEGLPVEVLVANHCGEAVVLSGELGIFCSSVPCDEGTHTFTLNPEESVTVAVYWAPQHGVNSYSIEASLNDAEHTIEVQTDVEFQPNSQGGGSIGGACSNSVFPWGCQQTNFGSVAWLVGLFFAGTALRRRRLLHRFSQAMLNLN